MPTVPPGPMWIYLFYILNIFVRRQDSPRRRGLTVLIVNSGLNAMQLLHMRWNNMLKIFQLCFIGRQAGRRRLQGLSSTIKGLWFAGYG